MIRIEPMQLSKQEMKLALLSAGLVPAACLVAGLLIGLGIADRQLPTAPPETLSALTPSANTAPESATVAINRSVDLPAAERPALALIPASPAADTTASPAIEEPQGNQVVSAEIETPPVAPQTAKPPAQELAALTPKSAAKTARKPAHSGRSTPNGYVLQAGSFRSYRNAQELHRSLQARGLMTSIFETSERGSARYRVIVGSYPSYELAAQSRKRNLSRYRVDLYVSRTGLAGNTYPALASI